jgi:hypothetical protein
METLNNSQSVKFIKTDYESVVKQYPRILGEKNFRQFHNDLCELVKTNSKDIILLKDSAKNRNPWFNSELSNL